MIRYVFLVFLFFLSSVSFGQFSEPLIFREKIHDFGNIVEQDGPATFEFVVSNKSTRPVKIVNVQPSCGCTTPDWTKEPIAVNATGFIKASYDPKGRPGYFDKTLTVTTDWDGQPILLRIKGNVINPETANTPALFTAAVGNLRFKSKSFNVGKVFINLDTEPAVFPFRNAGKDSIHFKGYVAPRYIKVSLPKVVAPDQVANIKIAFDAKLKNQYGFTSENVELKTDDTEFPEKAFSVFATTEEYFPKLSEKELVEAPVLSLQANVVNFGIVRAGAVLSREIKVTNTGKKELIIRHAQSNCTCLTISPGTRVLKPGQEVTLKITLDTQGRKGPQNKSITIYSTDPQNPVQRITFSTAVN
ncbi:MAG TPA: DUF1573 domain-containing protein [Cyclobacteriaceae bacterium]|jgi:hypothetical protein|nr:DUF1573 domain-containing protein [Cyclobacteriaceae bacterium]